MKESIDAIEIDADEIVIDGPHTPIMGDQRDSITRGVIGGDKLFHCVSAASIIAKVYRDKFMIELHQKYPQYNFQKNKGYPTKDHIQAIRKLGPSPYHRMSFKAELYDNQR